MLGDNALESSACMFTGNRLKHVRVVPKREESQSEKSKKNLDQFWNKYKKRPTEESGSECAPDADHIPHGQILGQWCFWRSNEVQAIVWQCCSNRIWSIPEFENSLSTELSQNCLLLQKIKKNKLSNCWSWKGKTKIITKESRCCKRCFWEPSAIYENWILFSYPFP